MAPPEAKSEGLARFGQVPVLGQAVLALERMIVWQKKWRRTVLLSDTTLRDGEQMAGVRLDPEQKVTLARALAAAGFDSIDAGSPAASAEEIEAVRRIAREVPRAFVTVHCRTVPNDIDKVVEAFEGVSDFRKGVTLFIGTSPIHREHKHRKSKAEIIDIAVKAIAYAKKFVRFVTFGPEDTARTEPDYLHEISREAIAAGATAVGFADTVGILTPEKAADRIKAIQDSVPNIGNALLAVHFHNDLGLGTANALACVAQGVNVVQGTINGIGERAGNTALEEVVMALKLHPEQYQRDCHVDPRQLHQLSRLAARLTGVRPSVNKAVVGENLFVTESGIHQDGLLKDPSSYVPFLPEEVGAPPIRLVLGKHSGRHGIRHLYRQRGKDLSDDQVERVLQHLKGKPALDVYDTEDKLDQLLAEASITQPAAPAPAPPGAPVREFRFSIAPTPEAESVGARYEESPP
jgi:2-isopropylmalate synthase